MFIASLIKLSNDLTAITGNGQIENFHIGADGKPYITYKVGADTVTKKLGSGSIKTFVASQLSYTKAGTYTFTYDLSSVYSDYKDLSASDIVGGIYSAQAGSTSALQRVGSVYFGQISYNASTGVITATVIIGAGSNNTIVYVTPCFYVCD